ncbi:MAG: hypothetical protein ACOX1W_01055 [Catenisphaera adipataccumulans]|jgi:hypothetical protein|uniref:hypothetical protein n=1 Tax=Catenisphaera adipataccumulans TaxID=700500 RepID=UPI003D91362F
MSINRRNLEIAGIIFGISSFVMLCGLWLSMKTMQENRIQWNDDAIEIQEVTVPYKQIHSVQLKHSLPDIELTDGTHQNGYLSGTGKCAGYGECTLELYEDCPYYIVIRADQTILINAQNEKDTKALYRKIIKKTGAD